MNKDVLKTMSISEVKSKFAKNILRGIIGEEDHYKIIKAINKIKKNCSPGVYKKSLEVISDNILFKQNIVSRNFNRVCPKGGAELLDVNPKHILAKINKYSQLIKNLLELHKKILININCKNYKNALNLCNDVISLNGVSCYLLRVIFYIQNNIEQGDSLLNEIKNIFAKIELDNSYYLASAIRELSNNKTDYFNICKKIYNYKSSLPENIIARNFISHVTNTEDDFIQTLNAFYSYSLFDAFLFYASFARFNLPFTSCINDMKSNLLDLFNELSAVDIEPQENNNNEDDGFGLDFFRKCFLLIEQKTFFYYKTVHGSFFNTNETKPDLNIPQIKAKINDYFQNVKSINDLRDSPIKTGRTNLKKYSLNNCNFLENSNALLFYLDKVDATLDDEAEDKFIKMMSCTRDIGTTCPLSYLQKLNDNAISDKIKLVIACLIHIKVNKHTAEHDLRRIIQKITICNCDSKIKLLLDDVYNISPSVTEHLIQICDETFLSKLFEITQKPNQAIEDRAEILEWYGEKINDFSYKERAKNLRIDVQINKEKGTIDDSRIYVDPIKYTQWISDNIMTDLTLLLGNICDETTDSLIVIDWGILDSGLEINERLGFLLRKSYIEFCENKLFGIASYLGRRIRHGTFQGTGVTEVEKFSQNEKYRDLFANRTFNDHFSKWLEDYKKMFAELKTSYLHIQSKKKPDGMLCSGFNTSNKIKLANQLVIEIIKSYKKNRNSLQIPYIITECCWLLVEEDLRNIRKFLLEKKSKHAVFGPPRKGNYIKRKNLQNFCQDLNSLTAEKFRIISNWFNKPSIASPTADSELLFNAVISEIKSFFDDFSPIVVINSDNLVITGGLYFAIYDALFILIYNVAKYGKKDGELNMDIEIANKVIKISIISEVKSNAELLKAQTLINQALESDFENAHIIEGRSGLKKLKRMEKDRYINNLKYKFFDKKIKTTFEILTGI